MKFQKTLFSINLLSICVILTICFSLVCIWFSKGLIFASGEEGIPFYNLGNTLKYYSSIWHDMGTGFSAVTMDRIPFFNFLAVFSQLGIPEFITQGFMFFILMTTGSISVFFLIKETVSKDANNDSSYQYLPLISSIFYLLNPFSMSQIFGRAAYMQFFPFALFPLFLVLYILGLKHRNFIFVIIALLVSAFLAPSFGNPSYVVSLWIVIFIYTLFYLKSYSRTIQDIIFIAIFFLSTFVGWIFINVWWLFPLLNSSNEPYVASVNNIEFNLGSLRGVSRQYPLLDLIRLVHKSYFFEDMYGNIYSGFIFNLISWIIPLLFLFSINSFKRLLHFKFFIVLFSVALFISLGSNFPTGWLFEFLFKFFPYFQVFRNPFEKFGLVLLIAYTPFVSLGILIVSKKIEKVFKSKTAQYLTISGIIFLICGIYVWPMWTGRFAGGFKINPWINVPDYYNDLQRWLDNKEQFRVLMTPVWGGDGAYYQWEGGRFQGTDPMVYLLHQQVISNGSQFPFYFDFIKSIRKYMGRVDVVPALSLLRTKYLVDRKDAVMITDNEKNQYKFLISNIYPPLGRESNLKIICLNMTTDSKANGLAWIVCRIPQEDRDLSNIKYLHVKIKTNLPAEIRVALRDNKDVRINWNGRVDSDYRTDTNDWQYITLPLGAPTENDSNIDLSKTDMLEVWANIQDSPEKSIEEINISEIQLDPGIEKNINEFKQVVEFGKLTVFEPTNFNSALEFGSLSSVNQVKDFLQLFEDVNNKRELTDKEGFLVTSQNNQKDLQELNVASSIQVLDKKKISESKYWIKINGGINGGFVILSKTFDSQWKIIPGVSPEMLDGDLLNNLNILKKIFIDEKHHYVVNGYANLWKIDDKDTEYAIVFRPQIIADIGFKISIFSILIMIGLILVWGISKAHTKYPYTSEQ